MLSLRTRFWLVLSLALVLLLATALPADLPERALASALAGVESRPLQILDCPEDFPGDQPHTVTMQIIDNEFHKWREYREGGGMWVYMEEPDEGSLSAEEAEQLLRASGEWIEEEPWSGDDFRHLQSEVPGTPESPVSGDAGVGLPPEEEGELESLFQGNALVEGDLRQARGVFGPDERTRITSEHAQQYPWNTVGYVQTHYRLSGTGFLVSPYTAITNAHNIYRSEYGGWSDQLMFFPGQTQEQAGGPVTRPYQGQQAVDAAIPRGYRTYEDNIERSVAYDYGAMFFAEPYAGISTFMPIEFNYEPAYVNIAGYPPRVHDETNSRAMWHAFGPVTGVLADTLLFRADASEGHSGGPIWVYDTQSGTDRVVGTIAVIGSQYNAGPRFADHNQELIEEWMRWTPETAARQHTLQVSTEGEGTTEPSPGEYSYSRGDSVELTAIPAEGWQFDRWEINGQTVEEVRIALTMDSDHEAVAYFTRPASQPISGVGFFIGSKIYFVEGEEQSLEAAPFIADGRTFVPMRPLAEALGADADWEPRSGPVERVIFQEGQQEVEALIGETSLVVRDLETGDTRVISMDVSPVIREGRTFLPFRFLAEAFGAEVDYATVQGGSRVDRVWFTW